jgi:hypothetical protein
MEPSVQELTATIHAQRAQLAEHEAAAAAATVTSAIAGALEGQPLNPGAAEQLTALLRQDVRLLTEPDGRKIPVGPGATPVRDFVAARLASPEFAHFRQTNAPAQAPPIMTATQPPDPLAAYRRGEETLAQAHVRHAATQRTIQAQPGGHPSVDMSKPFGLRRA